jgi:hypothetical protein
MSSVTNADAVIPPDSGRLRRTRFRGVHRLADRYVVVVTDEVGSERRVSFATDREARDFRRAIALTGSTAHETTLVNLTGAGGGGAL